MLLDTLNFEKQFHSPRFTISLRGKDTGKLTGTITVGSFTIDLKGIFISDSQTIEFSFYTKPGNGDICSFFSGTIADDTMTVSWLFICETEAKNYCLPPKGNATLVSQNVPTGFPPLVKNSILSLL